MKKINILCLLLALFAAANRSWAQGTSCQTATTFCTNTVDTFPAGINQPAAPTGNNYDCLITQPNPAWFTFTIAQSGDITFTLDNTNGEDIDFVLWGPFASISDYQAACGNLGNGGTSGGVVDCSYSSDSQEDVEIINAQSGEVYVLLVTNYSNQPTNIFSTANTGSGSFACDCDLSTEFVLTPIPQNQGTMVRADSTSAEFVVCAPPTPSGTPNQLYFTLRIAAPNPTDSLSILASATTISSAFPPGTFALYQSYAPGRYDSLDISIGINASYALIGIHNFNIGVINYGATSCIQRYPIRINIPGVEITANDTVLCPGIQHQVPLTANIYTASQGAGSGSYQWQQIVGQTATISNTTAANPTVTLPSNTINGDIFRFALTYTDSTGCITSDTIDFVMQTRTIATELSSSTNDLCNNGSIQTIQLSTQLDSTGIVANNGTFTWTNPSTLSNSAIGNPVASISGTSSADSITYIVRFDYGACSGADTLTLRFRNAVLSVTPDTATVCLGHTAQLQAMLSDTFVISTQNCNDYNVAPITFAPTAGTGTPVTQFDWFGLPDLDYGTSTALPIGFDFDFYCQPQDSFYINVNGFIAFNEVAGFGVSEGSIPDAFDDVNNIIAAAWADLDLSLGGSIDYFTTGTAPYRKLVINFNAVPYYFEPDSTITSQIILYETTNVIEIHNTLVNQCIGFLSSPQTQGIEDSTGTFGDVAGTRNLSNWTAIQDAYRFTPSVTYISSAPTYVWQPAATLNNSTIYNPIATPSQSTMYHVTVSDVGCSYIDSTFVMITTSIAAPTISCDSVTTSSVAFSWSAVTGAVSYEYSIDGINWTQTTNTSVLLAGIAPGTTINLQVRGRSNATTCNIGAIGMGSCSTLACTLSLLIQTDTATTCDSIATPATGGFTVFVSHGNAPFTYNIGAGAQADSSFHNLTAGAYVVTVTETATGCTETANFVINNLVNDARLNAWIGTAGQDTAISYVGLQVPIQAGYNTSSTAYQWTPNTNIANPNQASTNITTTTEGTFMYVVNASAGTCINSDTVWLVVRPSGFLGMPNGFSPDGDNQNDRFQPAGLVGATVKTFRIFNRWGQLVYDNADLSNGGWDGTHNGQAQPRDTYIYFVEFQLPSEPKLRQLRGEVTLLR